MGRRIDYYDDPDAPQANSIVPSVNVVVIYTDPKHIILYTSNGEARQEFSIVLTARATSGHPTPSSESTEVRWVPLSDVESYSMDRSMRRRIMDYIAASPQPYLD